MGIIKGDFHEVTYGYCKCGCGLKTNIAKRNSTKIKMVKGEPMRYLYGHGTKRGHNHPTWNSGRYIQKRRGVGYVKILLPGHPRSDERGYIFEHIIIVEKALGKYLTDKAVVHHIDGNGLNNENSNLVICQDQAYHMTLHNYKRGENGRWAV